MDQANQYKLKRELEENQQDIYILTPEEYEDLNRELKTPLDRLKTALGYVAPIADTGTAIKQIRELGFWGKVHEKTVAGRRYLIFKGNAKLRTVLRGTRYLANNPKVVALAIGRTGIGNSILSGAKLTFLLTAPISVIQALMADEPTLSSVVGSVAADLIKIGIASAIAGLVATGLAAFTCVAVGPLIAAIVIGVGASIYLESLDSEHQLTQRLIKFIDDLGTKIIDNTFGRAARKMVEIERILIWQAKNGLRVGKGVFIK